MVETMIAPATLKELAGVYWFDRRPIGRSDLRLASGLSMPFFFEAPGLMMVAANCADGPTVSGSAFPNVCTVDGRVDGFPAGAERAALDLYEEDGTRGLSELTGDWSLVIWDAKRRAIVLASDYAGARPLYYFHSSQCVAWSSSPARLAAFANRTEPDLDYIAEYLSSGFPTGSSPYKGIDPVPPGAALTMWRDGIEETTLWTPPAGNWIRYKNENEYHDQLRGLFREAVEVRLQTPGMAAAELSGGLDSSSVVCFADHLISCGDVPASGLLTFSYSSPDSQDRPYMAEIERTCRTTSPVHIETDRFPVLAPDAVNSALPLWAESRLMECRRQMEVAGAGVLLTGQLGDLIMGNLLDDSDQAADYLANRQFRLALKEAFAWSRTLPDPVYTLFWRALRASQRGPDAAYRATPGEDSLTPALRQRAMQLAGRTAGAVSSLRAYPSRWKQVHALQQILSSRHFQCPQPLDGLLYSHPFTHRPLVEFMLRVPRALVCRPGQPRRLMRRAFRGIVPDAILRRRSKGNYEGMYLKALRTCALALLSGDSMRLVEMGCVDGKSVAARLTGLIQGRSCNPAQLRQIIMLELWLRNRASQGERT